MVPCKLSKPMAYDKFLTFSKKWLQFFQSLQRASLGVPMLLKSFNTWAVLSPRRRSQGEVVLIVGNESDALDVNMTKKRGPINAALHPSVRVRPRWLSRLRKKQLTTSKRELVALTPSSFPAAIWGLPAWTTRASFQSTVRGRNSGRLLSLLCTLIA